MSKLKISNTKFAVIFTTLVYVINNVIILDKFAKWFTTKGVLDLTGIIGFFLVGLFLAIALFTLLAHKYTIKVFSIFIIIASTLSTYFIAKYNVAIDDSMVSNTLHTNTSESLTLFSTNMIPYLLFLSVIPIIIIIKTKIVFYKPVKHLLTSLLTFCISIAISISFVYLAFNSIHVAGNKSEKYILYQLVPVNFLFAIGGIAEDYIKENYISPPKKIIIEAKKTKEEDIVVVLAIGETSRQLNFSLYGYEKNTNPLLSKIEGIYPLNGIAKYGSTIWALPNILSRDDIKLPSISQHVGIPTSCYVNFQVYGNCGTVKEIEVENCAHNGKCNDEDVIPYLKKDLQAYKSGQEFIVLHLGAGSHGPLYDLRYPKEFQKFNPQCHSADVLNDCSKEELYNSFDNTILYVDYVVANIIDTLEKQKVPYVFIYVSDHGESLLENGRIFHGMPPGITLPQEQAQVPLLVKSSLPIKITQKSEYKQQDIYDTILDLLSIDTDSLNTDKVFIKKEL
jgi:lipid A ethanolaminephosphotransferase